MLRILYNNKLSIFVFLLIFSIGQLKAQKLDIDLKASIEPDSILIGDQVKLKFQVTYDSVYQAILLPNFDDNKIGTVIDIIEKLKLDTINKKDRLITIDQSYIITSFDSGRYSMAMPMLLQTLVLDSIRIDTLAFPPVELYVNTIPIDTATYQMFDIKAVSEYPFYIWDYWWVGLIILGVIIIAIALWLYIRWRKTRKGLFSFSKPKDPPYIIAINELQKLKSEKLWERDKTKLYYTRLTDIIRQYLEDTFGMQAMEKTSEEILKTLLDMNFDKKLLYDELKEMFMYSDLAKFAKYKPTPIENEQSYQYAYNFIEGTKPQEISETNDIKSQDDNNTKI